MKKQHVTSKLILISFVLLTIGLVSSCKKDKDDPVKGCTDPTSLTYNPLAEEDDGTCMVPEARQRALLINFTATW